MPAIPKAYAKPAPPAHPAASTRQSAAHSSTQSTTGATASTAMASTTSAAGVAASSIHERPGSQAMASTTSAGGVATSSKHERPNCDDESQLPSDSALSLHLAKALRIRAVRPGMRAQRHHLVLPLLRLLQCSLCRQWLRNSQLSWRHLALLLRPWLLRYQRHSSSTSSNHRHLPPHLARLRRGRMTPLIRGLPFKLDCCDTSVSLAVALQHGNLVRHAQQVADHVTSTFLEEALDIRNRLTLWCSARLAESTQTSLPRSFTALSRFGGDFLTGLRRTPGEKRQHSLHQTQQSSGTVLRSCRFLSHGMVERVLKDDAYMNYPCSPVGPPTRALGHSGSESPTSSEKSSRPSGLQGA